MINKVYEHWYFITQNFHSRMNPNFKKQYHLL